MPGIFLSSTALAALPHPAFDRPVGVGIPRANAEIARIGVFANLQIAEMEGFVAQIGHEDCYGVVFPELKRSHE